MTYLMVFFRLFLEFKLSSQMVSVIECKLITYLLAQACDYGVIILFALDDQSSEYEAELIRGIMSIYYL